MLGIPAYGVCSLDAIAAACAEQGELLVVTDARRKEVYWARYRHSRRVTDPAVTRPAEVDTSGVAAVAGSGVDAYDFGLPVIDVRYPPALEVVRCASDRIREGAPSDPLTPLYLRRPDAVANLTPKQVTQ
jgi:tRNA threonylcarbamoyl adenosine modification protein YeaZ